MVRLAFLLFASAPLALLLVLSGVLDDTSNASSAKSNSRRTGNGLIAFETVREAGSEIWLMDQDGGNQRRLTRGGHQRLSWSPDGRYLAIGKESETTNSFDIFVLDLLNGVEVNLTNHPSYDADPAWSPDGTSIAFISDRDDLEGQGASRLYLMTPSGLRVREVATSRSVVAPTWSPDGGKIAFQAESSETGSYDIFVVNVDGSEEENLTRSEWFEAEPSWSPDGLIIAFHSIRWTSGFWPGLYVMNPDGSNQRLLIEVAATNLSWSPDGQYLVYSRGFNETRSYDIYVVSRDGSGERNITYHPAPDFRPAWQPVARAQSLTPPGTGNAGLR